MSAYTSVIFFVDIVWAGNRQGQAGGQTAWAGDDIVGGCRFKGSNFGLEDWGQDPEGGVYVTGEAQL